LTTVLGRMIHGYLLLAAASTGTAATYAGTTPCSEVARTFLAIDRGERCESVSWRLTFAGESYTLATTRGVGQPNTRHLIGGGTRKELRGRWKAGPPGRGRWPVVVLEAASTRLSLARITDNVLQLMDGGGHLAIGDGGWSYTLNRDPLGTESRPPAIPEKATLGKLDGRFVGRTPCQEIARQLALAKPPDCFKLKWDLRLAGDRYQLLGTRFRNAPREGRWTPVHDPRTGGLILRLEGSAGDEPIELLAGDDGVLFFLDPRRGLLPGNHEFSYVLNRHP
jgi:hypothetical protein